MKHAGTRARSARNLPDSNEVHITYIRKEKIEGKHLNKRKVNFLSIFLCMARFICMSTIVVILTNVWYNY